MVCTNIRTLYRVVVQLQGNGHGCILSSGQSNTHIGQEVLIKRMTQKRFSISIGWMDYKLVNVQAWLGAYRIYPRADIYIYTCMLPVCNTFICLDLVSVRFHLKTQRHTCTTINWRDVSRERSRGRDTKTKMKLVNYSPHTH